MGTHRKNPVTALPKNQLMEGLHRLSREERLERVQLISGLSDDDIEILAGRKVLPIETAEHLIENVVGYFQIPLGVATNFCIDGKEILIPMAVEETSIIAAASAAAKWIKKSGTIRTEVRGDLIIGQIQIPSVREP